MEPAEMRVDVWTAAVRLFKTRSAASTACRGGHVQVNGQRAKPATPVRVGDKVVAVTAGGERIAIIKQLISKRVGAAVAVTCFEDLTPVRPPREEIPAVVALRERGSGRPTKRERRQLDRFQRGLS